MAILPIISFLVLVAVFYRRIEEGIPLWRTSFVAAALVWGALVAASTELLSLIHGITFLNLSIFWVLSICVAVYSLFYPQGQRRVLRWGKMESLRLSEWILILSVGLIGGLVVVMAWDTPPNNWDSMTYHMARVAHWVQNQSIEFYPTNIERQLWKATWAESAILHFQILGHGDRMANLIQIFSMIATVLAVTLIVQELGAGILAQILGAVITVTIPVGILEACSTQNDYVVAFWACCLAYFVLLARRRWNLFYFMGVALSAGLAILTKESGYIIVLPFLFWLGVEIARKYQWKKTVAILCSILMVIFVLNSLHYMRNEHLYQQAIAPQSAHMEMNNTSWTLRLVAFNAVGNLSLHMVTPWKTLNEPIARGLSDLLTWIKGQPIDIKITNPLHEDNSGNLLHLVLIGICMGIYIRSNKKQGINAYAAVILLLPVLFILCLNWNRYYARIHLPIFVLYVPFMAVILTMQRQRIIVFAVSFILIAASLAWVFFNESRPLIGQKNIFYTPRKEQYFSNNPGYIFSYTSAVKEIQEKGCSQIGLILSEDTWEYPLWSIAKEDVRFEHVSVNNVSGHLNYPLGEFSPCAIIHGDTRAPMLIAINGKPFIKAHQYAILSSYLRFDFVPVELQQEIMRAALGRGQR